MLLYQMYNHLPFDNSYIRGFIEIFKQSQTDHFTQVKRRKSGSPNQPPENRLKLLGIALILLFVMEAHKLTYKLSIKTR